MVCVDPNAEYDVGSEFCICKTGYTDSFYGCVGLNSLGTVTTEISRRLNLILDSGSFKKFTNNRNTKLLRLLSIIAGKRVNGKLSGICGVRSKRANANFYNGKNFYHWDMSNQFIQK